MRAFGLALCCLGWHRWKQWHPQSVQDGLTFTYTNARCERCYKREWFNW